MYTTFARIIILVWGECCRSHVVITRIAAAASLLPLPSGKSEVCKSALEKPSLRATGKGFWLPLGLPSLRNYFQLRNLTAGHESMSHVCGIIIKESFFTSGSFVFPRRASVGIEGSWAVASQRACWFSWYKMCLKETKLVLILAFVFQLELWRTEM